MALSVPTLLGWQLCDVPVWDGVRVVVRSAMILCLLILVFFQHNIKSGSSFQRGGCAWQPLADSVFWEVFWTKRICEL